MITVPLRRWCSALSHGRIPDRSRMGSPNFEVTNTHSGYWLLAIGYGRRKQIARQVLATLPHLRAVRLWIAQKLHQELPSTERISWLLNVQCKGSMPLKHIAENPRMKITNLHILISDSWHRARRSFRPTLALMVRPFEPGRFQRQRIKNDFPGKASPCFELVLSTSSVVQSSPTLLSTASCSAQSARFDWEHDDLGYG